MKLIVVESCYECPYLKFIDPSHGREYYYCEESGKILARSKEIVTEEASFNSIIQQVIPQKTKWTYVMEDEKTEWNGNTTDERCKLKDYKDCNDYCFLYNWSSL